MKNSIDWKTYGFLVGSRYRIRVILSLVSRPQVPSKIAKDVSMNLAHVSRTLNELESHGLVKCLTPSRSKGRLYEVTETGKRMIRKYKELGGESGGKE